MISDDTQKRSARLCDKLHDAGVSWDLTVADGSGSLDAINDARDQGSQFAVLIRRNSFWTRRMSSAEYCGRGGITRRMFCPVPA